MKQAIDIKPAARSEQLHKANRIHFGKHYTIEMNVQVRDVGRVARNFRTLFDTHYDTEHTRL